MPRKILSPALSLALATTAIAATTTATATPGLSAATPDAVTAAPDSLRWGPCPQGADAPGLRCATLDVPLDYRDPDGRQIQIAVSRPSRWTTATPTAGRSRSPSPGWRARTPASAGVCW